MNINDLVHGLQQSGVLADAAPTLVPVTIANGQSLSSAGALNGLKPIGFALPASFTKCDLSFQVSWDGSTWFEVLDSGRHDETGLDLDADPQSVATASWTLKNFGQSGLLVTGPWWFGNAQYLKIRSGAGPENPTAQGAERTLYVVCLPHAKSILI